MSGFGFLSGFLGALGATIGKISLDNNSNLVSSGIQTCKSVGYSTHICDTVLAHAMRASGFCLMLVCNAAMISLFIRALRSGGSLAVTVLSTAANFCCTGIFGYLVFNENISLKWIQGSFLIVIGSAIIVYSEQRNQTKQLA